jgi:hypothetical protein
MTTKNKETKEINAAVTGEMPDLVRLSKSLSSMGLASASANPWKDPTKDLTKSVEFDDFVKSIQLCKFFYKTEPIIATVINKLVEIGINDLTISKEGLSDNEFRVFTALKPRLLEYAETLAQEFFLSGLVVPEVGYGPVDKDTIFELGIKKYSRLTFPVSMWVRNPETIKINSSVMSDQPSYFFVVPDEVVSFVKGKGKYPDGRDDQELFLKLKAFYPEFVKKVMSGETEFLLNNKLIIRRKFLSDNAYPVPFISPVLDALQHKRKMRRVDYSIMDKMLGAILHVKVGSDLFPVTSSDEDLELLSDIRTQLNYKFLSDLNLERIFQLVTNHTVSLNWIFPDIALLKDTNKYDDINQEILFGLGFPRVLITGESQRTGTSDPEIALISPVKTLESMRRKIIRVIRDIVRTVAIENNFKAPRVDFRSLNLHAFKDFMDVLSKLYDSSAISRTTLADAVGLDITDELDKLEFEKTELESRGLSGVGVQPFSSPGLNNTNQQPDNTTTTTPEPKTKKNNTK